jgi:PleD family two-component response regulator
MPEKDALEAQKAVAPLSVLLIDDQLIVGEAIRRMLKRESDIRFQYCSDPAQALYAATKQLPSVILLDLVMPGMDGITLLRSFRSNLKTTDIPVIVLSAKEDPEAKAEAFSSGANDYMVKIPNPVELIARIRHHAATAERMTHQVRQQKQNSVQLILEELQHNLDVLENGDPTKELPALRNEAWESLSNRDDIPEELRNQLHTAYDEIQRARELRQRAQGAAAKSEAAHDEEHSGLDTTVEVLEGIKHVLPYLVKGLGLVLL